jgi:hypothetical protein
VAHVIVFAPINVLCLNYVFFFCRQNFISFFLGHEISQHDYSYTTLNKMRDLLVSHYVRDDA